MCVCNTKLIIIIRAAPADVAARVEKYIIIIIALYNVVSIISDTPIS